MREENNLRLGGAFQKDDDTVGILPIFSFHRKLLGGGGGGGLGLLKHTAYNRLVAKEEVFSEILY